LTCSLRFEGGKAHPVRSFGFDGGYSFTRNSWNHVNVRLLEGGRTQAIYQETITIPPPKVRAGIEIRYRSGHWQKYLKAKGWVPA
jgi:hypothetical protein